MASTSAGRVNLRLAALEKVVGELAEELRQLHRQGDELHGKAPAGGEPPAGGRPPDEPRGKPPAGGLTPVPGLPLMATAAGDPGDLAHQEGKAGKDKGKGEGRRP